LESVWAREPQRGLARMPRLCVPLRPHDSLALALSQKNFTQVARSSNPRRYDVSGGETPRPSAPPPPRLYGSLDCRHAAATDACLRSAAPVARSKNGTALVPRADDVEEKLASRAIEPVHLSFPRIRGRSDYAASAATWSCNSNWIGLT